MKDLAKILVEGRRRKGWTQEHLAAAAGVSLSTVTRAEQGKATPHRSSLKHLAAAVGLEFDSVVAALPLQVPHFGGVSAVGADSREEVTGDFTDLAAMEIDFTITVDGQCMEPRYEDGEKLGCSIARWKREGFIWQKDYWIRFKDGEMTLKRVRPDRHGHDWLLCTPLNPKARPFSRLKTDVESAARVIALLTS